MQQAHKASLLYSTEGDMKKGSLGPPKAASPAVSSASWSLHSSLQLDVQESQEMSWVPITSWRAEASLVTTVRTLALRTGSALFSSKDQSTGRA
ncbi:uncharacterized protein M8220_001792 isoform 2-T2 [Acridotheres tristis]